MKCCDNNRALQIDAAARLAAAQGQRWTSMRADVFEVVLHSPKPISAYEVIEAVSKKTQHNVKPPSVYRSLDALRALGLVIRIESLGAYTACQHPDEDHHHVFLVCQKCGYADELADHSVGKKLSRDAAYRGFRIDKQILELQGHCEACQG